MLGFRNICLWKIRLRIRSPTNIKGIALSLLLLPFSAFSALLVDHYFLSSNWSEGHVQASKQATRCPSPQHSVFTISNVVCDDKISAHGKTVNWILRVWEPRQLHHRHRARGHGRQGYGVVAAVASFLQFWHCLTLIFTAHSSTFPLLKATTCTFTPKNLWRHYTKQSFRHSYIFMDGHFSGSLYWHRWRFCSQASKIIQVERREIPCLYTLTS